MSMAMNVLPTNKIETKNHQYSDITGFRMQPLIELHSSKIVAYEILSQLSSDNYDTEVFFQQQTKEQSLAVFFSQFHYAKELLKGNSTTEYWINLPVAVIADTFSVEQLCLLAHEGLIAIEIQDPAELPGIDAVTRFNFTRGLHRLKNSGWMLCLDDITPDLTAEAEGIGQLFKGIKTCRSALPATEADIPEFIRWITSLREYASVIVVEGIETHRIRDIASLAGADLGQGFLWQQSEVDTENVPDIKRFADRLHALKNMYKIRQVQVCVPCKNSFWVQGVLFLMTEVLSSNGKQWELIPASENDAELVFKESWSGLLPIDCDGYRHNTEHRLRMEMVKTVLVYPGKKQLDPRLKCPAVAACITQEDRIQEIEATLRRILSPAVHICSGFIGCASLCQDQRLTTRELDIIRKFSSGISSSDIAKDLHITAKTVSNYKRSAMNKLGLQNYTDLMLYRQTQLM